ncbi:hypothetical protein WQ57_11755 [Mesobacillus campisalis]|uniref:Uncharacterized protein n=1 Tax=Mesobacillus campisalis TaxID=1408103 RepID=A0A0M2STE7_9BACI|nr:hypothetical protein [Mesobacillus campisalis]KKK37844.1 hypothetical protein WQ57_11755 [Mesobacillus campisalis]
MESYQRMLHAVKYAGGIILTIGIAIFVYGFFLSSGGVATGIGIGTVMGAIFIFIMGVFLAGTEEMLLKAGKSKNVI